MYKTIHRNINDGIGSYLHVKTYESLFEIFTHTNSFGNKDTTHILINKEEAKSLIKELNAFINE